MLRASAANDARACESECVIRSVDPTPQDLKRLAEEVPSGVPVVMVNLLKFRSEAAYASASEDRSGREAYETYGREITPMLARAGGRPVFRAAAKSTFIAPPGEDWDEVLLVAYPSIEAFLGMIRSREYQAITHYRSAALMDARLIATVPDAALDRLT